ncbi:MAG: hypothetical protein MZU95_00665 [Desulfomicrobium escambiense]|nr:hypothetical protein [Desulfomicrobium escambiense]
MAIMGDSERPSAGEMDDMCRWVRQSMKGAFGLSSGLIPRPPAMPFSAS